MNEVRHFNFKPNKCLYCRKILKRFNQVYLFSTDNQNKMCDYYCSERCFDLGFDDYFTSTKM